MHVRLVAGVEEEPVAGGVEDPVHGEGQLDHAEVGAEVAAGAGDLGDQEVTDLGGEDVQLLGGHPLDVLRAADGAQQPTVVGRALFNTHDRRVYRPRDSPQPGRASTQVRRPPPAAGRGWARRGGGRAGRGPGAEHGGPGRAGHRRDRARQAVPGQPAQQRERVRLLGLGGHAQLVGGAQPPAPRAQRGQPRPECGIAHSPAGGHHLGDPVPVAGVGDGAGGQLGERGQHVVGGHRLAERGQRRVQVAAVEQLLAGRLGRRRRVVRLGEQPGQQRLVHPARPRPAPRRRRRAGPGSAGRRRPAARWPGPRRTRGRARRARPR